MARQVITVFGGSGFIGRHVVRRLANAGWTVRAVCRDTEAANFLRTMGDVGQVIPWGGDVRDPASVKLALDGADAAINLVGILYESGNSSFEAVHVTGAKNVAEAAAAAGCRALVHMSALGADANSTSAYGRSKAGGEAAVLAAFPKASIVRPSVVFGPEDNFFNLFAGLCRFSPFLPVIGAPALPKFGVGGEDGTFIDFLGDGGPKFQPVYVGDVAAAIACCLENVEAAGQVYTLGGPGVYSFADMMRMLLKTTGRKRILLPVPFGIAEILAFFMQMLPKPLLTLDQVRMMESDNVRVREAQGLVQLGISPTPMEAILPVYLNRYRTPTGQARIAG